MFEEMQFRVAQRDCYCRGCDKQLKRNVDSGIFMYSMRNRGQNIMICVDCVKSMNTLVDENDNETHGDSPS
jgi:hypothetical protein